jgi:hypothetical protein
VDEGRKRIAEDLDRTQKELKTGFSKIHGTF